MNERTKLTHLVYKATGVEMIARLFFVIHDYDLFHLRRSWLLAGVEIRILEQMFYCLLNSSEMVRVKRYLVMGRRS